MSWKNRKKMRLKNREMEDACLSFASLPGEGRRGG
jgi:hypothetical protein